MTRAAMLAYLQSEFVDLALLFEEFSGEDDADGYKYVLNKAEAQVATQPSSGDMATYALLDYYALTLYAKKLTQARDANVKGDGGVSFDLSRRLIQVERQLARAEAQTVALGFTLTQAPGAVWSAGTINLDFLEPSEIV